MASVSRPALRPRRMGKRMFLGIVTLRFGSPEGFSSRRAKRKAHEKPDFAARRPRTRDKCPRTTWTTVRAGPEEGRSRGAGLRLSSAGQFSRSLLAALRPQMASHPLRYSGVATWG